jgi:Zn-dependent oligopeptidase
MTNSSINPLLSSSLLDQPFPFDQVQSADFLPAITNLLDQLKQQFDTLAANPGATTFETLIVPYEDLWQHFFMVHNTFLALYEAHRDDILERDAPIIARLVNDADAYEVAHPQFFAKIQALYNIKNTL